MKRHVTLSGTADEVSTTAAGIVVGELSRAGVELVFGLPGAHNMPLWPACAVEGIRVVGSRHEQGAVFAADGFSRVTGELGVALVSTGPGAANALGATGEAWAAGSPVLVIATDIPSTLRRQGVYRGALHECVNQAAMFEPVTKATIVVDDPDAVGEAIRTAIATALAPPSRPVYLEIPTDFLGSPARDAGQEPLPPPPSPPSEADVARALGLLRGAHRPVVVVGRGAREAGVEVERLAEHLGAPIVETMQGRGTVAHDHPWHVRAPAHEPAVTELIGASDVLLSVGSDLDAMLTQNWALPLPPTRLAINVDPADAAKNATMEVVLEGDAATVIAALLATLPADAEPDPARADEVRVVGAGVRDAIAADARTADVAELIDMLERELPPAAVAFTDAAIVGYWLSQYLPAHGRNLHHPAWGTPGFALPAAVGPAAAGTPAVVFCGDGGALLGIEALAIVAQDRLPVVAVVVDDGGGYDLLRWAHGADDDRLGTVLTAPDLVAIARGLGIEAVRVEGVGADFETEFRKAVASGGPFLIHAIASLFPPITTPTRWPLRGH